MECLKKFHHEFDYFERGRIAYNIVRNRVAHAPIPETYTIDNAILPFQCPQSSRGTAAHIFHTGCIGIYIWLKCTRTEQGRRLLNMLSCLLCAAPVSAQIAASAEGQNLRSWFPLSGEVKSCTLLFSPFLDTIQHLCVSTRLLSS